MNFREQKEEEANRPTVAPGMEMDSLEIGATEEEIEKGDYTEVTKLVIDRVPDEE